MSVVQDGKWGFLFAYAGQWNSLAWFSYLHNHYLHSNYDMHSNANKPPQLFICHPSVLWSLYRTIGTLLISHPKPILFTQIAWKWEMKKYFYWTWVIKLRHQKKPNWIRFVYWSEIAKHFYVQGETVDPWYRNPCSGTLSVASGVPVSWLRSSSTWRAARHICTPARRQQHTGRSLRDWKWAFKSGSPGSSQGLLRHASGQPAEEWLWLMAPLWDRSRAVGGCFTHTKRSRLCLSFHRQPVPTVCHVVAATLLFALLIRRHICASLRHYVRLSSNNQMFPGELIMIAICCVLRTMVWFYFLLYCCVLRTQYTLFLICCLNGALLSFHPSESWCLLCKGVVPCFSLLLSGFSLLWQPYT